MPGVSNSVLMAGPMTKQDCSITTLYCTSLQASHTAEFSTFIIPSSPMGGSLPPKCLVSSLAATTGLKRDDSKTIPLELARGVDIKHNAVLAELI